MEQYSRSYSIKDIVLPDENKPYLERNLRSSFLPLEAHCCDSLEFVLKGEGASKKLIRKARHLLNGMHVCQQYAKSYGEQSGREQQAQAYHRSALELEARLRLLLHDAYPPY